MSQAKMSRRNLILLFLGLVDAQKNGVIQDVLWMADSQETIWEALIAAIDPDFEDIDILVDPDKLITYLRAELAKETA